MKEVNNFEEMPCRCIMAIEAIDRMMSLQW